MAVKRGGLGRGMDALIPGTSTINGKNSNKSKKQENSDKKPPTVKETTSKKSTQVKKEEQITAQEQETTSVLQDTQVMLKISEVEPRRDQPRKMFDEDALIELSESIRQYGVLQPLLVQKREDYYEIIAGERRWRAARMAGLKEVPVVIREFNDQEVYEVALIENIQREDLNPIEEAQAYQRLMNEFHLRQEDIAERVSKSRAAVTNAMRLLKLEEKVQTMVIDGMLSSGHARALLGLTDETLQYQTAMKVFDEKLSVRETEDLIRVLNNPRKPKEVEDDPTQFIYETYEDRIEKILGTKCSIKRKKKGGKITLEYYSNDELDRLLDLFYSIKQED